MTTELTSNDVSNQAKDLLKDVDEVDKFLVQGYFRKYALKQHNLDIPSAIIVYCILYGFWVIEHFAKCDENRIKISSDGRTIQRYNYNGSHSTTYGSWIIPSTNASYIYKFTFKIIKKRGYDSIVIGIDESKCKWISDWYGEHQTTTNYGYSSDGYRYSGASTKAERWGESYTTDDVITMELNLSTKTLNYYKNDKYLGCAFENIKTDEYLSYCIAIYVQWESEIVQLISAKKLKVN